MPWTLRLVICAALLISCDSSPSSPTEPEATGSVRVIVTRGIDGAQDPDGYLITVADSVYPVPSAGDTILFVDRPAGERFTATISGLSDLCWVAEPVRSVMVFADSTVDLHFVVNCAGPLGFVEIITSSSGIDIPPQGVRILHNGGEEWIGADDTMQLSGPPGDSVDIQLPLGHRCWPTDSTVHHLHYPASGETVAVPFALHCGVLAATIYVTSGRWPFVLLNLDGRTQPLPLLDDTPGEVHWSPDGEQLLVVGGDLRLTRVDIRSGAKTVYIKGGANLAVGASWFPNGEHAIVTNFEVGDWPYLYDLDFSTGVLTRLPGARPDEYYPAIAPNGTELAFIGNLAGFRLETTDLNGTSRRVVADSAAGGPPDWTPDGQTLVFARDVPGGPQGPSYHSRIWKVARDGSGLTQLTFASWPEADGNPTVSRDGSTVVFTRYNHVLGGGRMMRIPISGGTPVDITTAVGHPFHATSFRP